MGYEVGFEQVGTLLRVSLQGASRDFDSTLEAWRRIAAAVATDRPEALLVVSNVQGEPFDVGQVQAFVAGVRGMGLESLRIAYVYPRLEGWTEVQAGEIFALEYGFEVRAFSNEAEAGLWLRHGLRE